MALQIKITLDHTTFFDIHHILQIAIGWINSHFFDFKVENYSLGCLYDEAPEDVTDANEFQLQ